MTDSHAGEQAISIGEPALVTADDLRALADAVDEDSVRIIRHENLLAVLKPEQPLDITNLVQRSSTGDGTHEQTLQADDGVGALRVLAATVPGLLAEIDRLRGIELKREMKCDDGTMIVACLNEISKIRRSLREACDLAEELFDPASLPCGVDRNEVDDVIERLRSVADAGEWWRSISAPMTDFEVEEIGVACELATPGPWKFERSWNNAGMPLADFAIPGSNDGATVEMLADDAAFACQARTEVPRLIAEVRRLMAWSLALAASHAQLRSDLARVEPVYELTKAWKASDCSSDCPLHTMKGHATGCPERIAIMKLCGAIDSALASEAAETKAHPIAFTCPKCSAEYTRGFFDGVSLFRCLRCGYIGPAAPAVQSGR